MAEDRESVKLKQSTLEIYREWAESTGRSVSGLMEEILRDAAMHYLDGRKAYARELIASAAEAPKPKLDKRFEPTIELLSEAKKAMIREKV